MTPVIPGRPSGHPLPDIGRYLGKITEAHGARHPELARIAEHFDQVSRDLGQHMMKEEMVLFVNDSTA